MKKFIITVTDGEHCEEFAHESEGMVPMAQLVERLRLRVRAIEEIPDDALTDQPRLAEMTIGVADKYQIHGPEDAAVFPASQEEVWTASAS